MSGEGAAIGVTTVGDEWSWRNERATSAKGMQ